MHKIEVDAAWVERIAAAYEQTAEGMQAEYDADPNDKCAGQQAESDRLIAAAFRFMLVAAPLLRDCREDVERQLSRISGGPIGARFIQSQCLIRIDAALASCPIQKGTE